MYLKVIWNYMKGNIEGDDRELKSVKNGLITRSIRKSGKFRFGNVAPTRFSQPFDDLTTARSHI